MFIELLRPVKIQAVAEQQLLGSCIDAIFLIMGQDLLAPYIRVAAVVANAGIVVHHGVIEVQQEQVRGDGIREGGSVIPPVFVIPVGHGIVVGIGQGNRIDALVHLDELMGIGSDGHDVIFFCQVHVGGAHTVLRLRDQPADNHILPLP